MAIQLTCACGRKLKVKDEFAGQEGQCPACGATLMIPYGDEGSVSPAPSAPVLQAVEEGEPQSDQEVRKVGKRREQEDELLTHAGKKLPVNGDYFADAPAEIGNLTSAYTTLRKGQRP